MGRAVSLGSISSVLIASAELSLVRGLRSTPTAAVSNIAPRPVINPAPEIRPREVINPTPEIRPRPVYTTAVSVQGPSSVGTPSMEPVEPEHYVRSKPTVEAPWATLSYATAIPSEPATESKPVKIKLIRTDTHARGAMIDFFC